MSECTCRYRLDGSLDSYGCEKHANIVAAMSEGKQEARAALNTDREIWREQRDQQAGGYSIHVTEGGGIGFNCGGHVIVMPFRKWFDLARQANQPQPRNLTDHQKAVEEAAGMPLDWGMANAATVTSAQGKAQPDSGEMVRPGVDLAHWIWQRFAGMPITEPYDGEFRLLLLKIASYTDELKQRQSFADFHTESTAFQRGQPESAKQIIELYWGEISEEGILDANEADQIELVQRGQQAGLEKAAQTVRNLVLVFQLTEQDLAERKGAEKMREAILEQFRSFASAEPRS